MPYKKPKIEKVFYSIGEVADLFGVNTSKIRFWENEFDILKPHKNNKGNRMFTLEDIENLKLINHLLKERGMTIKGAQKKLKENKEDTLQNFEVVSRLQEIRQMLIEIKEEL
ncbi:MAG: MerR family transcriptional regulator [Bacteroidota bacterium]|nr:MerR family transcriptional regulator [Bacteroidota bacterium]MDP3432258.1 MerR family transcriptional regulator [Bacteroidota bacterium]